MNDLITFNLLMQKKDQLSLFSQEDVESKQRQNVLLMKDLEEKLEEQEAFKNSLVQTHGVPTQIAKEVDKFFKQKL